MHICFRWHCCWRLHWCACSPGAIVLRHHWVRERVGIYVNEQILSGPELLCPHVREQCWPHGAAMQLLPFLPGWDWGPVHEVSRQAGSKHVVVQWGCNSTFHHLNLCASLPLAATALCAIIIPLRCLVPFTTTTLCAIIPFHCRVHAPGSAAWASWIRCTARPWPRTSCSPSCRTTSHATQWSTRSRRCAMVWLICSPSMTASRSSKSAFRSGKKSAGTLLSACLHHGLSGWTLLRL